MPLATAQNGQPVRPLVDTPNADIVNALRNEMSPDFQRRVPSVTQATVRETLENMMNYPGLRNQWFPALLERIGGEYIHSLSWRNTLTEFKKAPMRFGRTMEEIAVGLTKAYVYDPNQEYLAKDNFGTFKVPVQSRFHTVNREVRYPVTITEDMWRSAFTSETGIGQLISQVLESPVTSDNLDEYVSMVQLFAEYARLGGYFRVNVPDVQAASSTEADAKTLLRRIRAMITTLPIKPSTRYNAAKMPAVVSRDDLILFMSPETHAAIDVEALAVLFNEQYAQTNARIIDIAPEDFGMNGVQAILTTRDFFFCFDYLYEVTTVPNRAASPNQYNSILHHWEALSVSPFVPAILFWTGEGSDMSVTLPDLKAKAGKPTFQLHLSGWGDAPTTPTNVTRGENVQVVATLTVDDDPAFTPLGIRYELSGNNSPYTRIDQSGIITCALDETATTLHVTATATYINPNTPEVDNTTSAALDVPVVGDGVIGFTPSTVDSIKVTIDPATVGTKKTVNAVATATMSDGRKADVTNLVSWASSDPTKATVDRNGVVTGVAAGSSNISATVFGIASNQVAVTVTA